MIVAVADTHAVIWYLANDSRLSARAKTMFKDAANDGNEIAISTITLVEIVYLVERNRISAEYFSQLMTALDATNSVLSEISLSPAIVRTLTNVNWGQIPDMPDRIIAATGLHLSVPVISRDHKISTSQITTIW